MAAKTYLERFKRLFRGREIRYGQWKEENTFTAKGAIPDRAWETHLAGKGAILGVVPIRLDNQAYFGCIDLDDDEVNHLALAGIIEATGLPLTVLRSKSGGAHLYAFLKEPAQAQLLRDRLEQWRKLLRLENPLVKLKNGKMARQAVEIFPKQGKMTAEQDGNWINLPYYGNGETDRYAVLPDNPKLTLAEFLDHAEATAITASQLEAFNGDSRTDTPFLNGPPCLISLHDLGLPEGQRNSGMYNIALYFKLASPDNWEELTREYNESGPVDPPLKERELKGIISSVSQNDYTYNCDDLPIKPHCQKTLCRKQKYGVGGLKRQQQEEGMPIIGNLRKVTTDPPRWMLNVDEKQVELNTEDLMLIPRFRKAVLERCSLIFPLLRQGDWDDMLIKLLATLEIIEAPEEAGSGGQFKSLFKEFLTRRRQAQSREDLLSGMPWAEGGKVHFRAQDLMAFLDRQKFREYDPNQVYTEMKRQFGVGHTRFKVKKATVNVWFVDEPQDDQQDDFTPLQTDDAAF